MAEAAHNESLAGRLAEMDEFGWAATLLFYAAVHFIQAYFVATGQDATSHSAREARMTRTKALTPVQRHYDVLKDESEAARYKCVTFTESRYRAMQIRYGRLQGHMQRLVN